jgi:hypothetical protein
MKSFLHSTASRLAIVLGAALPVAHADHIHQFQPLPSDTPQMVWFQALNNNQPAASGHAGMLSLGMEPYASPGFPPALWGGWFSWTGEGAYLSYAGGSISTTEIHDPVGAAITDVRGALSLASALDVLVNAADGSIDGATLYSGVLFWTPTHLYLLLVGGPPTVYEVTAPGGGPIAGIRGVARMAARIIDMDDTESVNAVLWSGALVYTDTQLFLTRTHTIISTTEITFGGASIAGVRGVLPMGGDANPSALSAAAYVWTRTKVLLHIAGASSSTSEIHDPAGASINETWGMSRQTRAWNGLGFFGGAATIFQPTRQLFHTTLGPLGVQEVLNSTGAPIRSDVRVVGNNALLHQAGGLMEVYALRAPAGGGSQRGTVIGLGQ